MFTQDQLLKIWRLVKQSDILQAHSIAYQVISQELSEEMKGTLDEAFPGPISLGYQNPIELLDIVSFIIRDVVSISKRARNSVKFPLPKFFTPIHHDHNSKTTDEVIAAIAQEINPLYWEASVNRFDGLFYKQGKPYAYVELGWILPHKVRDLVHDRKVKHLWLFPYSLSEGLAPYYYVVTRASDKKCRQTIDEETKMLSKLLDKIERHEAPDKRRPNDN